MLNFFSFCISEKILIYPSNLHQAIVGHRMYCYRLFLFINLTSLLILDKFCSGSHSVLQLLLPFQLDSYSETLPLLPLFNFANHLFHGQSVSPNSVFLDIYWNHVQNRSYWNDIFYDPFSCFITTMGTLSDAQLIRRLCILLN